MSQTIATPSLPTALRRLGARLWSDPDTRSTSIGLLAVIIFHLLLWLVGPQIFRIEHIPVAQRPHSTPREFNIELVPETFAKQPPPKPRDPFKFVETNPEAPENKPDKTFNFGAQNQQVAQEKPTPDGKSERPATEGKKESETTQIVSGQLRQPIEHQEAVAPPTPAPVAEQPVAPPRREQNPLSGTEKFEGENKEGFGASLAKRVENTSAVPEKVEGTKDAPLNDATSYANQPAIDPKRPRPRPQVVRQQQVRPAILSENKIGTSNVGVIAHNALMTTYGQYLQRMIEAVQIRWEEILENLRANPTIGSSVVVKFVMNSDGNIVSVGVEQSSAPETATRACVSAITDRMPYGAWTDDMKAILGDKQEMVFSFHYQ